MHSRLGVAVLLMVSLCLMLAACGHRQVPSSSTPAPSESPRDPYVGTWQGSIVPSPGAVGVHLGLKIEKNSSGYLVAGMTPSGDQALQKAIVEDNRLIVPQTSLTLQRRGDKLVAHLKVADVLDTFVLARH